MSNKCTLLNGLDEDTKLVLDALIDLYIATNGGSKENIEKEKFLDFLKTAEKQLTNTASEAKNSEVLHANKLSVLFGGKTHQRDVVSITSLPEGLFNVVFKSKDSTALNSVVVDTEGKGLFKFNDKSYEVAIDTDLLSAVITEGAPSIGAVLPVKEGELDPAAALLLNSTIKNSVVPLVLPERKYKKYIKSIFTSVPAQLKKGRKESKENVSDSSKKLKESGFYNQYMQAKQAIGSPIQKIDSMLYSLVNSNLLSHPIEKVYDRLTENEGESDYTELKNNLDRDIKDTYTAAVHDLKESIATKVNEILKSKECK
jgi:hypothetical protein